jgi:hypothetical protein
MRVMTEAVSLNLRLRSVTENMIPEGGRPVQKDPTVRLDGAARRRFARTTLELADNEEPSETGLLRVHRCRYRETSRLSVVVRVWKIVHVGFDFDVQGPRAWAPLYAALVLFVALAAALVVPMLVLPDHAGQGVRLAVAAVAGSAVVAAALTVLLYRRLRRRTRG